MPFTWRRISPQGAKVDLHQHRNDHDPDENADRQVHLGHREIADELKGAGENLTERNPDDNAEEHPYRQVPFEHAHSDDSVSTVLPIASISCLMRNWSRLAIGRLKKSLMRLSIHLKA